MTQLFLDLPRLPKQYPDPPHRGRPTQIAAAEKIKPHTPKQRKAVLEYIAAQPQGATRQEIADHTGIRLQSVCGRVHELLKGGDVKEPEGLVRGGGQVLVCERGGA